MSNSREISRDSLVVDERIVNLTIGIELYSRIDV